MNNLVSVLSDDDKNDKDDYLPDNDDREMDVEDELFDYETFVEFKKSRGGRPKKLFSDLESRSQRMERLRPIYDQCVEFCENESLQFYEFLGLIGKWFYNSKVDDPAWSKLFKAVACGDNPLIKHNMTVERSMCFKQMCHLGSFLVFPYSALIDS